MSKKIIYYSDEINDDFAPTNGKINKNTVDKTYCYLHKNILWKTAEFIVYRIVATPLVWIYCKIFFNLKVKNRKALRKIKGGFYLYGNHTQSVADAFIPTIAAFPKKCYIITGQETVSIPGIKNLVRMLGAIPLASTVSGNKNMIDFLQSISTKKRVVAIYPEAHIWPYYNGIRNFKDTSFVYPVKFGLPAVGLTVVYRKRKLFKSLPPMITVYLSEPFFPDVKMPKKERKTALREKVYSDMVKNVSEHESYEYIRYVKN